MEDNRSADLFIFEDKFFITSKVRIKKVEEDRILLSGSYLLHKFATIGKKAYFKYASFLLPVKILGKVEEDLLISFPLLNPEKPVGDRRSARVEPSDLHPVKLFLHVDEGRKEFKVADVSEGGFAIEVPSPAILDQLMDRDVRFEMLFPREGEEVMGLARLVNIVEDSRKIKAGFEIIVDDAETVKIRFYIYSRIKEILRRA